MVQQVESLTAPLALPHGVPTQFATDAALITLLDRYPAELFDINRYDFDDAGQVSLTTGDRGRADGAAVLAAIKRGQLWVNLRGIEHVHPTLWDAIQRSFGAMAPGIGAKNPRKMTGQLILSSPTTRVPFHFDPAGVVLFHLRGRKRIWIYPTTEAFLPQDAMEKVIMRTTTEEMPYARYYDDAARVFDLAPGEAVTWPLYAPHRVENLDSLCVSLSMDFQTWESRITTGAHRANGVLRRWGYKPKPMARTGMAARTVLWVAGLAFKKLGLVKNNIKDFKRSFDVSAAPAAGAVTGVEEIYAANEVLQAVA